MNDSSDVKQILSMIETDARRACEALLLVISRQEDELSKMKCLNDKLMSTWTIYNETSTSLHVILGFGYDRKRVYMRIYSTCTKDTYGYSVTYSTIERRRYIKFDNYDTYVAVRLYCEHDHTIGACAYLSLDNATSLIDNIDRYLAAYNDNAH